MSDKVGPWTFDRSEKYESRRVKGGPLMTSDLTDPAKVERMKKRASVEALPDVPPTPPARRRKPVPSSVEHPTKEPSILEQLVEAKRKAGKLC